MHKTCSWILVLGLVGCGNSDPVSTDNSAPTTTTTVTAPASSASGEPQQISPEQAVTMAQGLIEKRNLNDASLLLNEAIRANPKLVDAYITRASMLADAKLYTRAIQDMDVALQLQPENAKSLNTRGYYYLLLQDNDMAMEDFNRAIALDLKYPQPLNNRGLVRISLGKYDTAVLEFDAALKLDPKYVDAHNNRGFALSQAKKYDEAIVSFTHAIELNDKYINAWNNRAQAQVLAGRPEMAITDFTKVIELQPTTMEFYEQRAEAYMAAKRPDLARQDLDHVEWSYELDALNRQLNAAPKDPQNWVARGNHLQQVARWDDAVTNYNDALKLDPECLAAQVGLAGVLFHQGKPDEALAACNTLLKAEPNREAHSLRGDILYQQGQYDGAIADYKASQRFDSLVAQAYLKRSEQRKASGEIQQASADLVQAVRMDPRLRTQAPEIVFPEDEAPAPVAPGAFPVEAADVAPLEPAAPVAVEPVAPTTP